ncbi:MAG: helix-turn-helix transcriptional regulator, partial [Alistipes sp.]|nr:helix-turn-helix transcriptional regulator [Alistipes sp.]
VKNITKLSVVDFIRLIRLKKAARMLQDGKHKINEVCYAVGITSPSYFSRLFYKQFGMRPRDFEKMHKPDEPQSGGEESPNRS